tara:strand:+ start:3567 stop:4658 length:1092 start_codon:yes stop_codon:yes gene_type:complete
MHFDLEDRYIDPPSLDSAMSWREQVLLSLFVHLFVAALILFLPMLPFVRAAEVARQERLMELAQLQQSQPLVAPDANRTFVFIEPRVDLESQEAPRVEAPFSDRDRVAQSPTESDVPLNALPNAEGNSSLFVESDDPSNSETDPTAELYADQTNPLEGVPSDPDELTESAVNSDAVDQSRSPENPGELSVEELITRAIEDGSLALPGDGLRDPDTVNNGSDRPADGLLGRAMRNLNQYVQRESFNNQEGSVGQFGPWIQFDSKGIEFGPWIRRFVAQIRRNWFIPYVIMSRSLHGNVALTFYVHRDGSISELTIAKPADVDAFTNSAFNALSTSNPTQPLPPEYPDDRAFFTVTFFFNESPPA